MIGNMHDRAHNAQMRNQPDKNTENRNRQRQAFGQRIFFRPARPETQALSTGIDSDLTVVDILPIPVGSFAAVSPMPINLEVPLSLTSHGRAAAQGLAESPAPDSELVPARGATTPISEEEAETGDPRRRRRRSSAGV